VRAVRGLEIAGVLQTRRMGYDGRGSISFGMRTISMRLGAHQAHTGSLRTIPEVSSEVFLIGARSAAGRSSITRPQEYTHSPAAFLRYSWLPSSTGPWSGRRGDA